MSKKKVQTSVETKISQFTVKVARQVVDGIDNGITTSPDNTYQVLDGKAYLNSNSKFGSVSLDDLDYISNEVSMVLWGAGVKNLTGPTKGKASKSQARSYVLHVAAKLFRLLIEAEEHDEMEMLVLKQLVGNNYQSIRDNRDAAERERQRMQRANNINKTLESVNKLDSSILEQLSGLTPEQLAAMLAKA